MPFIVPAIVAAGVATLFATPAVLAAAGGALAFFGTVFATTAVLGAIAQATQKNPRNPEPAVQSGSRTVTVRQSISPWEAVLGRTRKGGVLTFRYISPDQRFWHMVITLACHPCQAVDQVMLNDEVLALDANGMAQGKWAKNIFIEDVHDAVIPGTPFAVTVPTTVTAVQEVLFEKNDDGFFWPLWDRSPAEPDFYGYKRSGSVFTFHSGLQGKNVHIRTFNGTENSYVRVKISLGNEVGQPFPDLVSESNGSWSNDHLQRGHTKIYMRLEANPDVFPLGVPNVTVVMRGANDVFDPRTSLSGYSNNGALCTNWYLTNAEFGPGFDYDEEVDEDDLITAANDADTAVPLAAGGSEARYAVNGTFSSADQPKAVLERLLGACAGMLVDLGDKWRINMGVYHAPTVTLSESDLAGPNMISPHLPAREDANGVKGVFINPNAHWQPDDFPAIEGVGYLAEDGGKRQWADLDFSAFVTSATQAQRLAKIELLKRRQPLTERARFRLAAWAVVPGRTVARTDTQLGWSSKPFEVTDSELVIAEDGAIEVELTLRETAAAIYDWDTSEEGFEDLAPNTSLPDPADVPAPGAPAITEALYETLEGRGVAVKAIVTYTQSSYPFGARYQLEFKKTSDSAWTVLPAVQVSAGQTGSVVQELLDFQPGRFDFRVLAIGMIGAKSDYTTTLDHEIGGLGTAPSAPTGVSLAVAGGHALITLDQHPDLDVRNGGRILVRHTEEIASQTWESSFSIGALESWPGSSVLIVLPLKPGSYLLKARDSSGQESATFATAETKQASVLPFTAISTLTENPNFTGTHTDTTDNNVVLSLGLTGSDVKPSGNYQFATGFDFTTVKRVRITGIIEGSVVNVIDLIDSRLTNIDDWQDFDGNSGFGSEADAWLECRETDDNPSGAPTWSEWKRIDSGEFECRGMQFRAQLRSFDSIYNVEIDVLKAESEEVL